MTAPLWQAGTLYPNGSIVQPQTVAPPISTTIPNAGFESGDTGWDKDAGWTINNTGEAFTGTWSAEFDTTATNRKITGQTLIPVVPGQSITLTCQVQQGASSAGQAGARVALAWFDAADVELSESLGNLVDSASGGAWRQSLVTGIAPAGAAKVAQRAIGFRNSGSASLWVDTFAWNYVAPPSLAGLIYKAVQPTTGSSGTTEPAWPGTPGLTVVDNEVTWECIAATRVTWEAHPLLVSGSPEPNWPTVPGGTVADGNLIWVASSRRVEDENCPNTKVVAIIASHVFAVDVDIVRFSAAINPLDWTSEANAGFLPTGLQQANANNLAVLGTYRKNLVPMNANVLQLWAMDPDPELMQPIDQLDGIGSIFHQAATAVADDLFYLAALGVRSVSMSGASRNLSSGDIGEPVDELVQAAMAAAIEAGIEPISTYYPSLGQYLLTFAREAVEGWVPIDESAVDYLFVGDAPEVTMAGSVVTYSGASDGTWRLQLAAGTYNLRIVCLNWAQDNATFQTPGQFTWPVSDVLESQSNTAPDIGTAFEPTPLDITIVVDNLSETNELVFNFLSENQTDFQFQIFVEAAATPASTTVFVYSRTKIGNLGSWSIYEFPFAITEYDLRGNQLYFRHGDVINVFDAAVTYDELAPGGEQVAFPGAVYWNYLDCGQPGNTKAMTAFDFVGTGLPSFSVGWDERDWNLATTPYAIDPDTLPGGIIPLNVWGPSLSMRVDFAAGTAWSLSSVIIYVDDMGNGP